MTAAVVALFTTSCDLLDEGGETTTYELSGDKYIGTLTVLGTDQEDIVFYADASDDAVDLLMPEVSFMSGLMPELDMALISIPLTSENPDTYSTDELQMVGISDRLPLINDVIQSITNIVVEIDGYRMTVTFDCAISTTAMGDMTVPITYEGLLEGAPVEDAAFTLDNEEGFYITNSYGETLIEGVTVSYYEGNNALVLGGFTFSTSLAGTELPITGLTASEANGKTTVTGDNIVISYTFMTLEATGTITDLTCEIIDDEAQFEFTITASMGGSGTTSDYYCTYNGAINVLSGSY